MKTNKKTIKKSQSAFEIINKILSSHELVELDESDFNETFPNANEIEDKKVLREMAHDYIRDMVEHYLLIFEGEMLWFETNREFCTPEQIDRIKMMIPFIQEEIIDKYKESLIENN